MLEKCTSEKLSESVDAQLKQLANANHCGAGMLQLMVAAKELCCRIRSTDRLACEVESIHVSGPEYSSLSQTQLDLFSQQLIDRLSYLEERLVLVEKDESEAQIRSELPPIEACKETFYFELIIGHKGLTLHRYKKEPDTVRRIVPAVFTRAVLCRLVSDLLGLGDV